MSLAPAPALAPPVLELRAVSASVAGRVLVRSVSLQIAAAETVALVGPSGAGKSTLARLAAGFLPAASGSVWLDGQPWIAPPPRQLWRRVQMVFQDPQRSLDPTQTIAAAICEGLESTPGDRPRWGSRLHRWRREVAAAWLRRVGLDPALAPVLPAQLSGGQRQRVAIARALAVSPRLLVADEPTSALDNVAGAHILALLRQLQLELGFACLLVSHHLAQAAPCAQRIAVMDEGVVVELAASDAILRRPQHPCTQRLLAALPPWPPVL